MPPTIEQMPDETVHAETEEPADDDDDDDEPIEGHVVEGVSGALVDVPEPEPLATIGPTEIAKAERAIAAQRKKLAGILGDDYVAHDCPLCVALGFLPELPPPGTVLTLIEQDGQPAVVAQPPEPEPEFVEAKDKTACDWCDALGLVRTGSRNPHAAVVPCTKCAGNGWVMKPADAATPAFPVHITGVNDTAIAPTAVPLPNDAWGRPAGHQHWGVPPSEVGI